MTTFSFRLRPWHGRVPANRNGLRNHCNGNRISRVWITDSIRGAGYPKPAKFMTQVHDAGDKRHTRYSTSSMKPFRWGAEKNEQIKLDRGVSFEVMVVAIEAGGLIDILAPPNPAKYPKQRVLVVASSGYAYLVPFVEEDDHFFLKAVIPSRKATRDYLNQGEPDAQI